MVTTGVIFFLTYLGLAIGGVPGFRMDRTGIALIGATAMLVFGALSIEHAYRQLNYRTLLLLFGMMVVVAHLRISGFFAWAAARVIRMATGPYQLLAAVIMSTGFLSAFFVNDTVCLIFTPFLIGICKQLRCSPLPYLLALATASNIGSVATITGNPQNMIIGTFSHISYYQFVRTLAPVAATGLVIDFLLISWLYRKELKWTKTGNIHPMVRIRVHRPLLIKSLTASLVMIIFFFLGSDISLVALAAAAAILITRRVKPKKVYREIDWEMLTLFAGLFVVIAAVEQSGLSREFFLWAGPDRLSSLPYLAVVTALLSNLVSNVPAVLLFQSFIPHLPDPQTGWLILAMTSTLAGNLTLLGSIANLIVAQGAREELVITFRDYARLGFPLTLLTLAVGLLLIL